MLNFIFNILYMIGTTFLEHPFIYSALFFGLLFAIIIKKATPSKPRKLTEAERELILETAKRRKKENAVRERKDLVCINCGAPLKAEYAVCEYCGARARMNDGTVPE